MQTPRRLLGVWAHPDDEAYLSAGLMARVADAGGRVVCVTATRGELAGASATREQELRDSLAVVGAHELRIIGHPDGECAGVTDEEGIAAIVDAIESCAPDTIVTFGEDGVTGHPDHVAVHRWTAAAWTRTGAGELLLAVKTDAFFARFRALHRQFGVFGDHRPIGTPERDLDLVVDLEGPELDRKRAALAAHASQTAEIAAAVGEPTYRAWIGRETFRAAVPGGLSENLQ